MKQYSNPIGYQHAVGLFTPAGWETIPATLDDLGELG